MTQGGRIKALDGLRGVAAMVVLLHHLGVPGFGDYLGRCVITLFFILSGYLMRWRYPKVSLTWDAWRHIMLKKAIRFYPLHWLALSVLLLFSAWGWRWDLPLHVALLQSLIPCSSYCFSYNLTAWFISTLMVCYALFPVVTMILNKLNLFSRIGLQVGILICFWTLASTVWHPSSNYYFYIFPPARLIDFMTGMILCDVVANSSCATRALSQMAWSVIEVLSIIVVVAFVYMVKFIHVEFFKPMSYALWWYLPVCIVLTALVFHRQTVGCVSRLLSTKPIVFLGRISMEVFLLQHVTLSICRKSTEWLGLMDRVMLVDAISVAATIIIAYIAHRFCTMPLGSLQRRYLSN